MWKTILIGMAFAGICATTARAQTFNALLTNLDSTVKILVNGVDALQCTEGHTCSANITKWFSAAGLGVNKVQVQVFNNTGGGYAYGVVLWQDGVVILNEFCGLGKTTGCSENDGIAGLVREFTLNLTFDHRG